MSALGCSGPPPAPAIPVAVQVRSETGAPVGSAELLVGPRLIARTGADGRAGLDVRGAEGESFEVRVKCPRGFQSPTEPLVVRRLAVGGAARVPEYAVTCHETRHTLVVAVRANGGANLPVLYLGKEVARTDRSGAAHIKIDADAHERIELTLGTSGENDKKIHPQNPMAIFDMPDHDDIQLFQETFTHDARKAPAPARAPTIKQF